MLWSLFDGVQVLCGAVYVIMVEGGSECGYCPMMLSGVERMHALSCMTSMLKSMRSARMYLLGALDAGGELLYSPQLVTCLSLTRGLSWMKEYQYCYTDNSCICKM